MSLHQQKSTSEQSRTTPESRQRKTSTAPSTEWTNESGTGTTDRLFNLQDTIGNQAVSARLGRREQVHGRSSGGASAGLPSHVQAILNRQGTPLDDETREDMESRFDHDFSDVRIHTDGRAIESARRTNARAYTLSRDIVFAAGEYDPATRSGKRLLAHELAHVIQQERVGTTSPAPTPRSAPERAANRAARAVAGGSTSVQVSHATAPGIARQPRSLVQSLDPTRLTGPELDREIQLIREWLIANPGSSPEHQHLQSALTQLERHREATGFRPQRYNLSIGDEIVRNGTIEEVLRVLRNQYRGLKIEIDSDEKRHKAHKKIREEHYIVGSISDLFGRVTLPSLDIWEQPKRRLAEFVTALHDRNIERALAARQEAIKAWKNSHKDLYKYITGTIEGAERAVTGLEITRDVSFATVGTLATGGFGLAAGTAVSVGVTATGAIAQQTQEIRLGLRERIDWASIAFEALFEIVTAKIPGLGDKVVKRLLNVPGVPSLGRRAIARLTSEVTDILQEKVMGVVSTVTKEVFNNLRGAKEAMSASQVLDAIARQLLDPKQAIRGYLIRKTAGHARRLAAPLPRTRREARARREAEASARREMEAGAPPTREPTKATEMPAAPEPTSVAPEAPTPSPVTRPMKRPEPVGGAGPLVREVPKVPSPEPTRRPTETKAGLTRHPSETEPTRRPPKAEEAPETTPVKTKPTRDNQHDLKLTPTGRIIRCSDGCHDLSMRYREILDADDSLRGRLENLQELAQRAVEKGDSTLESRVLDESRALEADLKVAEAARLDWLATTETDIDTFLEKFEQGGGEGPIVTESGGRLYVSEGPEGGRGRRIPYYETRPIVGYEADGTPKLGEPIPEKSKSPRRKIGVEDVRRPEESFTAAWLRMKKVIGRRIDQTPVAEAWQRAREHVLGDTPIDQFTKEQVNRKDGLYDQVRAQLWIELRKPEFAEARRWFEAQGFEFTGKSGAPVAKLGPQGVQATERGQISKQEQRVSLDHVAEKAQGANWLKALDADNLKFSFQNANAEREISQRRHRLREGTGETTPSGTSGYVPLSRGAIEAHRRNYPQPPEGYHWRLSGGVLSVQNNLNNQGPKLRYDPENEKFVLRE